MKNKLFNLYHQYSLYLERMALDERLMSDIQKQQLKTTFMCSWGQCLLCLREDVAEYEDDEAVNILEDMMNQVSNHILALDSRQN